MAAVIEEAHNAAVADALAYLERGVLFSRRGAGGVRQVEVTGLIGAAFAHGNSRAGDPNSMPMWRSRTRSTLDKHGSRSTVGPCTREGGCRRCTTPQSKPTSSRGWGSGSPPVSTRNRQARHPRDRRCSDEQLLDTTGSSPPILLRCGSAPCRRSAKTSPRLVCRSPGPPPRDPALQRRARQPTLVAAVAEGSLPAEQAAAALCGGSHSESRERRCTRH